MLSIISVLSTIYLIQSTQKATRAPSFPIPSNLTPLKIIKSYPGSGEFTAQFPQTALIYTFNQPFNQNKIEVEVMPNIDFKLSQSDDEQILYIHPLTPWKYIIKYSIIIIIKTINYLTIPKERCIISS